MEALQRLHMSPVGSPFGMSHHESMLRTNASVSSHDDRKSPMDTRLIMQVSRYIFYDIYINVSARRISVVLN